MRPKSAGRESRAPAKSLPVDAWQWRQILLSKHAPKDPPTLRLVALVIEAHMSAERSEAWPSQATIAERAQISVRQTRRVLDQLEAEGWLMRTETRLPGQKWRLTKYSASVPLAVAVHVPLHAWQREDTSRAVSGNNGETPADSRGFASIRETREDIHMSPRSWEPEDIQMSSPSPKGKDTQMSAPSEAQDVQMSSRSRGNIAKPCETLPEGFDDRTSDADVRTSSAEGEDISAHKVRTFDADVRTSGCPTKSSSEEIIGSNHVKSSHEGALARTARVMTKNSDTESGELERKIRHLAAKGWPSDDIHKALQAQGATLDQVKQIATAQTL